MTDLERVTRIYYPTNRPIRYTDTVGGKQTCVDNLWAVTTEELLAFEQAVLAKRDEEHDSLVGQLELHIELCHKEIANWKDRCERRVTDIKELEKRHANRLESLKVALVINTYALQSVYWTDEGRIEADMPAIAEALSTTTPDTALQKALLEARISQMEIVVSKCQFDPLDSLVMGELYEELRAQLLNLKGG